MSVCNNCGQQASQVKPIKSEHRSIAEKLDIQLNNSADGAEDEALPPQLICDKCDASLRNQCPLNVKEESTTQILQMQLEIKKRKNIISQTSTAAAAAATVSQSDHNLSTEKLLPSQGFVIYELGDEQVLNEYIVTLPLDKSTAENIVEFKKEPVYNMPLLTKTKQLNASNRNKSQNIHSIVAAPKVNTELEFVHQNVHHELTSLAGIDNNGSIQLLEEQQHVERLSMESGTLELQSNNKAINQELQHSVADQKSCKKRFSFANLMQKCDNVYTCNTCAQIGKSYASKHHETVRRHIKAHHYENYLKEQQSTNIIRKRNLSDGTASSSSNIAIKQEQQHDTAELKAKDDIFDATCDSNDIIKEENKLSEYRFDEQQMIGVTEFLSSEQNTDANDKNINHPISDTSLFPKDQLLLNTMHNFNCTTNHNVANDNNDNDGKESISSSFEQNQNFVSSENNLSVVTSSGTVTELDFVNTNASNESISLTSIANNETMVNNKDVDVLSFNQSKLSSLPLQDSTKSMNYTKFYAQVANKYYCTLCETSKQYQYTSSVTNHIKLSHFGMKYKCPECSAIYTTYYSIQKHYQRKHKTKQIPESKNIQIMVVPQAEKRTKYSGQTLLRKSDMHRNHEVANDNDDNNGNDSISDSFEQYQNFLSSKKNLSVVTSSGNDTKLDFVKQNDSNEPISSFNQSELSLQDYTKSMDYSKYYEQVANKYYCKLCENSKKYLYPNGIITHIKTSHFGVKYKCPECNAIYTSYFNIRKHYESKHKTMQIPEAKNCTIMTGKPNKPIRVPKKSHYLELLSKQNSIGRKPGRQINFLSTLMRRSGNLYECITCANSGKSYTNKHNSSLRCHIKTDHLEVYLEQQQKTTLVLEQEYQQLTKSNYAEEDYVNDIIKEETQLTEYIYDEQQKSVLTETEQFEVSSMTACEQNDGNVSEMESYSLSTKNTAVKDEADNDTASDIQTTPKHQRSVNALENSNCMMISDKTLGTDIADNDKNFSESDATDAETELDSDNQNTCKQLTLLASIDKSEQQKHNAAALDSSSIRSIAIKQEAKEFTAKDICAATDLVNDIIKEENKLTDYIIDEQQMSEKPRNYTKFYKRVGNKFYCKLCETSKKFVNYSGVITHINCSHFGVKYKCPECSAIFTTYFSIRMHYQKNHKTKQIPEGKNITVINEKATKMTYKSLMLKSGNLYTCKICNDNGIKYLSKTYDTVRIHIKSSHPEQEQHQQNKPGRQINVLKTLMRKSGNYYVCTICADSGKSYTNKHHTSLSRHIKTDHLEAYLEQQQKKKLFLEQDYITSILKQLSEGNSAEIDTVSDIIKEETQLTEYRYDEEQMSVGTDTVEFEFSSMTACDQRDQNVSEMESCSLIKKNTAAKDEVVSDTASDIQSTPKHQQYVNALDNSNCTIISDKTLGNDIADNDKKFSELGHCEEHQYLKSDVTVTCTETELDSDNQSSCNELTLTSEQQKHNAASALDSSSIRSIAIKQEAKEFTAKDICAATDVVNDIIKEENKLTDYIIDEQQMSVVCEKPRNYTKFYKRVANKFYCKLCETSKKFLNYSGVITHINCSHFGVKYKCPECSAIFTTYFSIRMHYQKKHNTKQIPEGKNITVINEKTTKITYKSLMLKSGNLYTCKICKDNGITYISKTYDTVRVHIKSSHLEQEQHQQNKPGRQINVLKTLMRKSGNYYACTICADRGKSYRNKHHTSLRRHIKTDHLEAYLEQQQKKKLFLQQEYEQLTERNSAEIDTVSDIIKEENQLTEYRYDEEQMSVVTDTVEFEFSSMNACDQHDQNVSEMESCSLIKKCTAAEDEVVNDTASDIQSTPKHQRYVNALNNSNCTMISDKNLGNDIDDNDRNFAESCHFEEHQYLTSDVTVLDFDNQSSCNALTLLASIDNNEQQKQNASSGLGSSIPSKQEIQQFTAEDICSATDVVNDIIKEENKLTDFRINEQQMSVVTEATVALKEFEFSSNEHKQSCSLSKQITDDNDKNINNPISDTSLSPKNHLLLNARHNSNCTTIAAKDSDNGSHKVAKDNDNNDGNESQSGSFEKNENLSSTENNLKQYSCNETTSFPGIADNESELNCLPLQDCKKPRNYTKFYKQVANNFYCKLCETSKKYLNPSGVITHINSSHFGVKYKCPECSAILTTYFNMRKHYQRKHRTKQILDVKNIEIMPGKTTKISYKSLTLKSDNLYACKICYDNGIIYSSKYRNTVRLHLKSRHLEPEQHQQEKLLAKQKAAAQKPGRQINFLRTLMRKSGHLYECITCADSGKSYKNRHTSSLRCHIKTNHLAAYLEQQQKHKLFFQQECQQLTESNSAEIDTVNDVIKEENQLTEYRYDEKQMGVVTEATVALKEFEFSSSEHNKPISDTLLSSKNHILLNASHNSNCTPIAAKDSDNRSHKVANDNDVNDRNESQSGTVEQHQSLSSSSENNFSVVQNSCNETTPFPGIADNESELNSLPLKNCKKPRNYTKFYKQVAKKFYCKLCETSKKYLNPSGVTTHIKSSHFGLKYKCPECSAIYTTYANIRKHYQRKHRTKQIPEGKSITVLTKTKITYRSLMLKSGNQYTCKICNDNGIKYLSKCYDSVRIHIKSRHLEPEQYRQKKLLSKQNSAAKKNRQANKTDHQAAYLEQQQKKKIFLQQECQQLTESNSAAIGAVNDIIKEENQLTEYRYDEKQMGVVTEATVALKEFQFSSSEHNKPISDTLLSSKNHILLNASHNSNCKTIAAKDSDNRSHKVANDNDVNDRNESQSGTVEQHQSLSSSSENNFSVVQNSCNETTPFPGIADNESELNSLPLQDYKIPWNYTKFYKQVANKFYCKLCETSKKYLNPSGVITHIKSSHFGVKYKCPECSEIYTTYVNIRKHYQSEHKTKQIPDGKSITVLTKPKITYKSLMLKSGNQYTCKICNDNGIRHLSKCYETVRVHIKSRHLETEKYRQKKLLSKQNSAAKKTSRQINVLRTLMRKSGNYYVCTICADKGISYRNKHDTSLRRHIKTDHQAAYVEQQQKKMIFLQQEYQQLTESNSAAIDAVNDIIKEENQLAEYRYDEQRNCVLTDTVELEFSSMTACEQNDGNVSEMESCSLIKENTAVKDEVVNDTA